MSRMRRAPNAERTLRARWVRREQLIEMLTPARRLLLRCAHQGVSEAGPLTGDGDLGSPESGCELTSATFTRATPLWVIPIFSAALFERSRVRP